MKISPFTIDIPQAQLDDLHDRLRNTNWPHDYGNDDWQYGTNTAYLRDLVDYWINEHDWRAAEAEINSHNHFKTDIDGMPIHFIHEKGKGPEPIPLILSHGWPWCFWDLREVIGPLTDPEAHGGQAEDAFDVVIPSLPGFGFSTPLATPGINFWRTADMWHKLMKEGLGYDRFGAQGGDWGALVTNQLGHKYANSLIGIHLTNVIPFTLFNTERPCDITGGNTVPEDITCEARKAAHARQERIASHVAVHVLDPQTLAVGLHDSPVGLLSWLVERRRAWGDCNGDVESRFTREHLITTTMIYWLTNSFNTSARYYAEAAHNPWQPAHTGTPQITVPVGVTLLEGDNPGGLGRDTSGMFDEHYTNSHPTGGHFAPMEEPEVVVADIRATFRSLR